MNKKLQKVLMIILCLSILMVSGCKGKITVPPESSSSENSSQESTDSHDSEASQDETESGESSAESNSSAASSGKTSSSKASSGSDTEAGKKDTSIRDLKGRTISYVVNWPELKKGENQRANDYWKTKESIEKKYNCKIKHVYKTPDAIEKEVIPSILSGAPIADVFYTSGDKIFPMIKKNMLYPVSDLNQFDFTEDKWGGKKHNDLSLVNGKRYYFGNTGGAPAGAMLLYNIDYFKANNLPDLFTLQKEGKWDWTALKNIAKDATKGDVIGLLGPIGIAEFAKTFIQYNGGVMVKRGTGLDFSVTLNSKNTTNALTTFKQMVTDDKSTKVTGMTSASEFAKGKAAMYWAETYRFPEITSAMKFKLGGVTFPSGPDAPSKNFLPCIPGAGFVIPATVSNPKDIAMILDKFIGADNTLNWEDYYYDMVYSKDIITTFKKIGEMGKNPFTAEYVDAVGDLYGIGLHGPLSDAASGQQTPAQAIESLETSLKNAVKNFGK